MDEDFYTLICFDTRSGKVKETVTSASRATLKMYAFRKSVAKTSGYIILKFDNVILDCMVGDGNILQDISINFLSFEDVVELSIKKECAKCFTTK